MGTSRLCVWTNQKRKWRRNRKAEKKSRLFEFLRPPVSTGRLSGGTVSSARSTRRCFMFSKPVLWANQLCKIIDQVSLVSYIRRVVGFIYSNIFSPIFYGPLCKFYGARNRCGTWSLAWFRLYLPP